MFKFTFDGHGINDANDEYKPRVATLNTPYKNVEIGILLAAAPELLEALRETEPWLMRLTDEVLDGENIRPEYVAMCEQIRGAIKKATNT